MWRAATTVFVMVGAAACSTPRIGDGDGEQAGGDREQDRADARPIGDPVEDLPDTPDGAVAEDGCYRSALARLELVESSAYVSGTGPTAFYGLTAAIDGVPVGIFYLDLYGGLGSLSAGVLPGDYPIQGDDTIWSVCAVCAWATFGVSEERWVMAQSGTVRLDQVDTRLAGSLENVELVEIDEVDEPIPGGCSATVSGISFDVLVE